MGGYITASIVSKCCVRSWGVLIPGFMALPAFEVVSQNKVHGSLQWNHLGQLLTKNADSCNSPSLLNRNLWIQSPGICISNTVSCCTLGFEHHWADGMTQSSLVLRKQEGFRMGYERLARWFSWSGRRRAVQVFLPECPLLQDPEEVTKPRAGCD